jgi:hypothetical protein
VVAEHAHHFHSCNSETASWLLGYLLGDSACAPLTRVDYPLDLRCAGQIDGGHAEGSSKSTPIPASWTMGPPAPPVLGAVD